MSTTTKRIVINNDFVQQSASHIVGLFKPSYNPFTSRPVAEGGSDAKHFALQRYNYSTTDNPIATMYNQKNIISNLFLCTEDFLDFIGKINKTMADDTLSRVFTKIGYKKDVYSNTTVDPTTVDSSPASILLPLVQGPTGNKACHFAHYEALVRNGLQQTNNAAIDGVASTSISEIFLRHLYSIDARKRNVAFQIAELWYGLTNSECVAAKLGFIPAKDFNSDLFNVTLSKDEITMDYANPIELDVHYDETIHNPNGKKLYLYFPYITSNALRPKIVGEDNNHRDGLISLYTGSQYDTQVSIPTQSASNFNNSNGGTSFTFMPGAPAGQIGTLNQNKDMAVLTNSIWKLPAKSSGLPASAGKFVEQCGFTVINITETGGGGDITFDHTDKIDFIDSLKFVIKAPTVFA